jgi:hypothetical protein
MVYGVGIRLYVFACKMDNRFGITSVQVYSHLIYTASRIASVRQPTPFATLSTLERKGTLTVIVDTHVVSAPVKVNPTQGKKSHDYVQISMASMLTTHASDSGSTEILATVTVVPPYLQY